MILTCRRADFVFSSRQNLQEEVRRKSDVKLCLKSTFTASDGPDTENYIYIKYVIKYDTFLTPWTAWRWNLHLPDAK